MPGREHELNEKQTRAKCTQEFKQETVRQVKAGRAASAVAATLGMRKASLTNWVRADTKEQLATTPEDKTPMRMHGLNHAHTNHHRFPSLANFARLLHNAPDSDFTGV